MNCINDRRTKGFLSLDALLEAGDPAKFRPLSDCGDGARQIRSAPDRRADILSTLSTSAEEKLAKARDRLVANGLARLLPAAIGTSAAVLTGCYIGKAEFKGEDMRICPFNGTDGKCDACADK